MSAVKDEGHVIGWVERTNGGNWVADFNAVGGPKCIGAYPSRAMAVAAVRAHLVGAPRVGQIKPTLLFGPPAQGMSASGVTETPQ